MRIRPRHGQLDGRIQGVLGADPPRTEISGRIHLGFRGPVAAQKGAQRRDGLRLRRRLESLRPLGPELLRQRPDRSRPHSEPPHGGGALLLPVALDLVGRRCGEYGGGPQRKFLPRPRKLRPPLGGALRRDAPPPGRCRRTESRTAAARAHRAPLRSGHAARGGRTAARRGLQTQDGRRHPARGPHRGARPAADPRIRLHGSRGEIRSRR